MKDPIKARLKAESKFHEVLAAAMFTSDGVPVMHQKYTHAAVQEEVEPKPDEE